MVQISAFRGLRPDPAIAAELVSVPYDVVDREEARAMAAERAACFLRIVRSDLEFPDEQDAYANLIYERARENLEKFRKNGWLLREESESLYVYRLNMGSHQQTGLVAGSAIEDYRTDKIKKHEFTRPDKEKDRTRHIDVLGANTGPVFLLYNSASDPKIAATLDGFADASTPLYDLSFDDGVRHRLYRIAPDRPEFTQLLAAFQALPATYIADGHHRAASAFTNGQKRIADGRGDGPHQFFLSVIFPDNQLRILPYNRVVQDLNGLSVDGFLAKVRDRFDLSSGARAPGARSWNMYLDGQWYHMQARDSMYANADEIGALAVSVLQKELLQPTLAIEDPRTSERIAFVGGIRGDKELERLVNSGRFAVAFSMPPVTPQELTRVADAGKVMPPKSTWFEPKLRSGFVVHLLDE
ncbi:MAG: DUF1015 domain-containing protein [Spirochaetales bacterium]|nr:DUF1015 domain-containing protein [Leptospiraceae bacterium]MCP5482798.1 DUF1015 domain-containing protein [Spirochaetales bacterium]